MGMFYNGANCDIYIGKGAGKKLKEDITHAQKSIKIISPYLSPALITELIDLKHRRIDVQLITVDKIEDYKNSSDKNIYKLIRQHRHTDEIAQNEKKRWEKAILVLLLTLVVSIMCLIGLLVYSENLNHLIGLIPIAVIFCTFLFCRWKNNTKQIYSYSYSLLFPFKVYMSPEMHPDSDTFIHSKIYIIDDSIAYMGSLNLTISGTRYNYETRIRTTDYNAVKKIKEEFHNLFHYAQIPEADIQAWGKSLYQEPIN